MLIRQNGHSIEIYAPAKVNSFLELLGRRADGFHEIDTIMHAVSLYDHLTFRICNSSSDSVSLTCHRIHPQETDSIPNDDRNLVVKACHRVREFAIKNSLTSELPGIEIELQKTIPSAAGLGGASSDCAAALVGAALAWQLPITKNDLLSLATELGSDVPFFLSGGTARCQGRGEIVSSIDCPAGFNLVIAKPPVSLSTRKVFGQVEAAEHTRPGNEMVLALKSGDAATVAETIFNRLETAAYTLTSEIQQLAGCFEKAGCLGHQMSGSGSSYFGLFASQKSAQRASRRLASELPQCRVFAVRTLAAPSELVTSAARLKNSASCCLAS